MPERARHETLLEKLVGFDTISVKSNRACMDFIQGYLDGFKIRSEILISPDGAKACLWATIGPDQGSGIVLAGHSDTVPVEGQDWASDPFTLTERGGKFYGRGSCDMKAFIACALAVVPEFAGRNLKRPVHLAFTYDEELNMDGAAQLTDYMRGRGIKPEWVWIGEPTGLRLIDSHKGITSFATSITGVAAHGSLPDNGLNAINLAAQFIGVIQEAADARKSRPWPNSRFTPPYTTFNVGVIKGGTAENIIPDHCEISWQAREHPGDDIEATLADIEKKAAAKLAPQMKAFLGRGSVKTCLCIRIPPLMPTSSNPGQEALARLTGRNQTEAVSFATEGGFFQKLGAAVIICGPGHIEQAHQPDEYVEKSQLDACVDLIRRVMAEIAV